MPTFAPNSVHTAHITVKNSGGDAGVFVRGQVQPGGDVQDSSPITLLAGAQAEITLGPLTMPSAAGAKQLMVEIYWHPPGGTVWMRWGDAPIAAGETVTIAAPTQTPAGTVAGPVGAPAPPQNLGTLLAAGAAVLAAGFLWLRGRGND